MLIPGTPMNNAVEEKRFSALNAEEILIEMKILLENISDDVQSCVFRSNHASNYLALKGKLSRDKNKMLEMVNQNLDHKLNIRPEYYRAL